MILLTPGPLQSLPASAIFWIDALRQHLAEAGHPLEIHAGRAAFGSSQEHSLARLVTGLQPAGWVLHLSTEAMQRWFSQQRLPCVIVGSRHTEVELPCVDIAYRAVCRHAVGQFVAAGHRRLVLLNPQSGAAGDIASEEGFWEAVRSSGHPDLQASIVRHDGTVAGICRRLNTALARTEPPTALLVSRPAHVLTAMTHLMLCGRRLPQDIAVISRDDDPFLEHLVPAVTRYSIDPAVFARKISRLVVEMARGGAVGASDHRVMPRFIPGQTLVRV